jgi:acetyl-CoA C-acetyltransferase
VAAAVERAGIEAEAVDEVILGNGVSAGLGQAPARQAALFGGLPRSVPCTTINKVCASGMKSVMMAAQSISAGQNKIVMAGGFESMSNVPYYLPGGRNGMRYGHGKVLDGLLHDGLWDVYNEQPMGNCGDICATEYSFSREDQDRWAIRSYENAARAIAEGLFKDEIVPVEVPQRRGDALVFDTDEEPARTNIDKIPGLRPAFRKDGTVTAANASPLNDGATGIMVMSGAEAKARGLKPLAKIRGEASAL